MPNKQVTILTGHPIVAPIATMALVKPGIAQMMDWVRSRRPDALTAEHTGWRDLMPHRGYLDDKTELTDNEILVELAGRKCYDSFADRAGRKTNKEYIEHTQQGDVPHASIMYHAKISLFIAGVSRRVSHELIRNYVGSDRDEEGSPSQESTRFTHHYGHFICPPRRLGDQVAVDEFAVQMQVAYDGYNTYIDRCLAKHEAEKGEKPKGLDRKRIYEDAAGLLPGQAETSWIWTSNPVALAKMIKERSHESADLEFQRLAKEIKTVCMQGWPNCFPQPWMHT